MDAQQLKAQALALGFARAGVARAAPLGVEADALREWLSRGYHGSMGYMAETAQVRCDPSHQRMLAEARSLLVVAAPYARARRRVGPHPGRVARYAWGRDYHNVLTKRLQRLARRVRDAGHQARACVDTMPVLERAWAQRAGIGFVGKNSCLIVPGLGSHVFLGAVISDAPLTPDVPMQSRCGSCRRCLDDCPTDAFVAPRMLDARRCIAYLTIEHRGSIDPALREGIGDWIFGCDACQDTCPYNQGHALDARVDPAFEVHPRWSDLRAEDLLKMDQASFRDRFQGSPLRRAGREGNARNAAIVMGNSGDRRHLPVLREAARSDESAVVREACQWACARLQRAPDDPTPATDA